MKRTTITPENIFEMCDFADDILFELRMTSFGYDLSTLEKLPYGKSDRSDIKKDLAEMNMARSLDISEVDDLTISEIKSRYLDSFLPLAQKLFRAKSCYVYAIDENLSDKYLDDLLCERFRDLLRICVIQQTGTELKDNSERLGYSSSKWLYAELKRTSELGKVACTSGGAESSGRIDALLDALSKRAIEYAMLRAHQSTLSDEAATARNGTRSDAHDLLMQSVADYLQYIKSIGLEDKIDQRVLDYLNSRKAVGRLACYIAYEKALGK